MKKFMNTLLRRRSLANIAEAELIEAQLRRMQAESALEHAQSAVDRHTKTIGRLRKALEKQTFVERGQIAQGTQASAW